MTRHAAPPSLDNIAALAAGAALELTEHQAWPKATGMFAWLGNTLTDNGERKFTYIGLHLWLGTDGRLWFVHSRNWFRHAVPVVTDDEDREFNRSRRYVPLGLTKHDLTDSMDPILLRNMLPTPEHRSEFQLRLETKVARLKAKKK